MKYKKLNLNIYILFMFLKSTMSEKQEIYRHKFTNDINELMQDFSKLHMFDNKDTLIDQFETFWDNNKDLFLREKNRLESENFNKDVKTAIFRSIKYYHIKKLKRENEGEKTVKEKEPRDYIKLNKYIIQWIDIYIINSMKQNKIKPSVNFNEIIKNEEFKNLIKDEKPKIVNKYKKFINDTNQTKTDEEIESWWNFKIKKTYKNRYFNITQNNKKTT